MGYLILFGVAVLAGAFAFGDDGGDEAEVVEGDSGNDTLITGSGDDTLYGNTGDDGLFAGDGDDRVFAGAGDDIVLGGEGDDLIRGGTGNDELFAQEGQDTLYGDGGNDVLITENAFDLENPQTVFIGGEQVTYYPFTDTLTEDEADEADGGAGDDFFIFGDDDTLTGGEGEDVFRGGFWASMEDPATVTDFNPGEDLLSFVYDSPTLPEVRIGETDDGDATVELDGQTLAILAGVPPSDISLSDIRLSKFQPL